MKRIRPRSNLHNPGSKGKISSKDFAHSRREIESRQLVSCGGPRRGERTVMGTRMVRGSFLKDIPSTFAFNALHQPYQLH